MGNLPARNTVPPGVLYLPVDPSLLASYHAALDAVAECPFYDEERADACGEAGDWELLLFRELGFVPHFDRTRSPRPTNDASGVALRPGTAMTVAPTAISMCAPPEVPDSYVLIGAHVAAEGLCNNIYLYRLLDPEYKMWEQLATIEGVVRDVEPRRRPCMACDEWANHRLQFGAVTLELCRECYRPLVPVQLLDLAHRGKSTFFGNEALIRQHGPRAPEHRAALEDLAARIRARAAAGGDSGAHAIAAQLTRAVGAACGPTGPTTSDPGMSGVPR